MDSFKYKPFTNAAEQVRLLRFDHLGEPGTRPSITLETFEISASPSFTALSYVAGSPLQVQIINCNGKRASITENANTALCTLQQWLRSHRTTFPQISWIWIDAISINQLDAVEKSAQIRLMKEVFGLAAQVIVYFGSPQTTHPNDAYVAVAKAFGAIPVSADGALVSSPEKDYTAFNEFWSQVVYTRSWIIQELILAKAALCLYGSEQKFASWDLDGMHTMMKMGIEQRGLGRGFLELQSTPSSTNPLQNIKQLRNIGNWLELRREYRGKPGGLNPVRVLMRARFSDTSDTRDRIYSLLGLFERNFTSRLVVNYSPSYTAADAFRDFARLCIEDNRGTELLEQASIVHRLSGLPTWCPDWTAETFQPLPAQLYSAAGTCQPHITLRSCGNELSVRGFVLDTVLHRGDRQGLRGEALNLDREEVRSTAEHAIWLEFEASTYCNHIADEDGLIHGASTEEVTWRTLLVDEVCHETRRCRQDDKQYFDAWKTVYATDDGPAKETERLKAAGVDLRALEVKTDWWIYGMTHVPGHALSIMNSKRLGLVPNATKRGDSIAIFCGGRVPFVIRAKDGTSPSKWEIVGPCYIHGVMDGELMDQEGQQPVQIILV